MLKLASCDSQGSVYISDDSVFRLIERSHEESVLNVLNIINAEGIEGIVSTEICPDGEVVDYIDNPGNALLLKHSKIPYISYPHEWCASMLKDSALFHLDLSERLFEQALCLKDAHPWNILFDRGRPVFVDFTSIVSLESLLGEAYLESNKLLLEEDFETRLAGVFNEIFERMYLPYFVAPLHAYAFGQRSRVRKAIEKSTLNASTSTITLWQCLPRLRLGRSVVKGLFGVLGAFGAVRKLARQLLKRKDVESFCKQMQRHVEGLEVAIGDTAYSAYYAQKGEDQDWAYLEQWNDKQKAVYNALNKDGINSVLDVACNTGWFAIMAETLGKSVVAFDIDDGCIENLYRHVKQEQLNILPLVMNFTELTADRYSIYDGQKVLINASQRLSSDSVLALGVIHHLILGLGLSFEDVLDRLIALCEKQLVIEFVKADDAMIKNEPSFFPAYHSNRELLDGYDLERFIGLCKERGFEVSCEVSHPATRSILVCNKVPVA